MNVISYIRYASNEIKKNWKNKLWWKGRLIHHIIGRYYRLKPNKGTYIMKEDWDNLIILDACRYDTFVEVTGIDCDYKISRGSRTPEFLRENFIGHKFKDTVYVSANPYTYLIEKCVYKVVHVWKFGWDDELGTVLPKTMVKYSLEVERKYPNKKLIIHFMQPHFPYINDPEFKYYRRKEPKEYIKNPLHVIFINKHDTHEPFNPFREIEKGNIDVNRVYDAYKRNLKAVLPHAFYLAKKLKGKTVITADHGEAFGEFAWPFPIRIYEHPPHVHIPVLIKVPWLVIENGERREIEKVNEKRLLKECIRSLNCKRCLNKSNKIYTKDLK